MIAKKREASKVVDSRRGLMHSVAKILAKKLANRLAPYLQQLPQLVKVL
jgi:hypothetical protein